VSLAAESSVLSAHVRYPSREGVEDALFRLGVARGAPIAVWPPRRLPFGLYVSPERNGWVSLWSPLGDVREWFPRLAATLEAPGLLLEVIDGTFWIAEFFRDDRFLGRVELPTEAVKYDDLWARTYDSLEAEGVEASREDEARFGARLDEIAASDEYEEAGRQLEEERPEKEALVEFLPAHANLDQAWELLWAIDHDSAEEGPEEESGPYAEDFVENFASYLGIRDATWNPTADAEAFAEGDYEDEDGLPEGWRGFHVLPIPHLPMLG
jgi:hypothetical protein